jgi:hypothetical protein
MQASVFLQLRALRLIAQYLLLTLVWQANPSTRLPRQLLTRPHLQTPRAMQMGVTSLK